MTGLLATLNFYHSVKFPPFHDSMLSSVAVGEVLKIDHTVFGNSVRFEKNDDKSHQHDQYMI